MLAPTARASRPKLSLAVPATSAAATAASKRPTLSLAVPTMSTAAAPSPLPMRSPLPAPRAAKDSKSSSSSSKKGKGKRVQFREEADIKCITPLPNDCYGAFVKMNKEERRWARAAAAYE